MQISDDDVKRISAAVAARIRNLAATGDLTSEEHSAHHRAVAIWIERTNRRAELFESIKKQVGGWTVIALLGGIGYAVWEWAARNAHNVVTHIK